MANYIVSYDLNGDTPTHDDMDKHMDAVGWVRHRILETVWYVGTRQSSEDVFNHVKSILSNNDQLLVVHALQPQFYNLLIDKKSLIEYWRGNAWKKKPETP